MLDKRHLAIAAGSLFLAASIAPRSHAAGNGPAHINGRNGIRHVLLISVDGMHALDYLNCVSGGYCPNLAALGSDGVNYLDTSTSKPSDSFPGLTALVTGGSPRVTGVNYDVAYDRDLNPPAQTTGNGLSAGPCTAGETPSGTSTEFDEGIDINQALLNGGAPSGDGGINSIDPQRLERDQNCNPVYPWNFYRVNTIFGVIHRAGGYTAWSDKHPSYSSVGGPTGTSSDSNVDDYYSPEINSYVVPLSGVTTPKTPAEPDGYDCSTLPSTANLPSSNPQYQDVWTDDFQFIQCYDTLKVHAILNEIDGRTHDGSARAPVPTIFGMNFQAESVGQKLIEPGVGTGGYTNSNGTPGSELQSEIEFADASIGEMISELKKQNLLDSTLVIITAKHGQSPIDSSRYVPDGPPDDPASLISSCIPDSELNQIGPTEDDVALLWLKPSCDVATEVADLESLSPPSHNIAGIGEIFWGPALSAVYNPGDSRAPDILITPDIGVTYSNSKKKLAEHGGFSHDDTNVIMLVSKPGFHAETITSAVQTMQVAPTILSALGLDPDALRAVQMQGTPVLPGLHL